MRPVRFWSSIAQTGGGDMPVPAPLTPEIWQQHPFVRNLAQEHRAILNTCAMLVQFETGQTIFREGDPANRFYLLLSGVIELRVRTTGGGATPVCMLGAGDVLGWSWLFPPYQWHLDAVARESARAVFFYGTWLRHLTEGHHELGYELMRRIAEVLICRLQAARRQALSGLESAKPVEGFPRDRPVDSRA